MMLLFQFKRIKHLKNDMMILENIIIRQRAKEEKKKNDKKLKYIKELKAYGLPNEAIKKLIEGGKI